ncbi:glycosyltransferase family 9 protein [Pelagibius litoralis]|uniref:Glycosyltransferase family 9 protein n=1 Tax=Pelagibius litoralis TaxID=374515 RepID=A0A967F0Q8_9PROT|nr:glycosyltransferase family 9 protein [Pelagibius litoralis]NIA70877.1 glycosyltransferase family 9 protein [Pelagibius litoralis]
MTIQSPQQILVIKLSALGDFVLSIASFQAIRAHHRAAEITLLTTVPYRAMAEASGCFDRVWIDRRPAWWQLGGWLALKRQMTGGGFERVYDLQRSDRSGGYFRMLANPKPEWVGTVAGASHRYVMPGGPARHICDREADQLALAGVPRPGLPDLSFLTADLAPLDLPPHYALLVPGGSAHRPGKRWPAERYAALARHLLDRGMTPLLLGAEAERAEIAAIARVAPGARDLCGRTSLEALAALGRGAGLAVGNDTGPMHLIAASGAPSLVLYSHDSDPAKIAPRGARVETLRREVLAELSLEDVIAALPAGT